MEEESEDANFISVIVVIIIVILLAFIFRNQIYDFWDWVFDLIQEEILH